MGPAQKRGKVDQGRSKDSLLILERGEINVCIPLAEFLPALVDEQGNMAELWWCPLESIVQCHMHWRGGHPFLKPLSKGSLAIGGV